MVFLFVSWPFCNGELMAMTGEQCSAVFRFQLMFRAVQSGKKKQRRQGKKEKRRSKFKKQESAKVR